jgi:murein DD-endopeptidase MepM/ murein hydrolase activator NlpD
MTRPSMRVALMTASVLALTACEGFDPDLRGNFGGGLNTSSAVTVESAPRPEPDNRGIISYPSYQVVVARRGDTISDVARRIEIEPTALARFNGIPENATLRKGEILALPQRVSEPSPETGSVTTGPIVAPESIDIEKLASGAIERAAPAGQSTRTVANAKVKTGEEPIRHKVERGETAFSISRLYGVSVRSLADWNGLDSQLTVREGQFLLIPVAERTRTIDPSNPPAPEAPGQGSVTPTPPSASKPLPDEDTTPQAAVDKAKPESPNLGAQQTASAAKMVAPVTGSIIRDFRKGRNDGIDLSAAAGTPVKAAAAGTVAAITEDTDQVPIIVLRHADGLLTVYAQVDGVKVKKGDKVKRGETIATVRAGNPAFVHFEIRKGVEAVDPNPFISP